MHLDRLRWMHPGEREWLILVHRVTVRVKNLDGGGGGVGGGVDKVVVMVVKLVLTDDGETWKKKSD